MEVEITAANFAEWRDGVLPLVVDCWAEWCGPCRALLPTLSSLAAEYDGRLVVGKCNIDEYDALPMEYGVRNIPTLLFFKGGQLVDRYVGSAPRSVLAEKFAALVG